jgi:hypothetical protein
MFLYDISRYDAHKSVQYLFIFCSVRLSFFLSLFYGFPFLIRKFATMFATYHNAFRSFIAYEFWASPVYELQSHRHRTEIPFVPSPAVFLPYRCLPAPRQGGVPCIFVFEHPKKGTGIMGAPDCYLQKVTVPFTWWFVYIPS